MPPPPLSRHRRRRRCHHHNHHHHLDLQPRLPVTISPVSIWVRSRRALELGFAFWGCRYRVIEILAGGGCALVKWRLETGRTHQIRAHAKYLGVPLLGDEVYGGTKSMALSLLQSRNPSSFQGHFAKLVARIERPCLHALSLGFRHPITGESLQPAYLVRFGNNLH